MSLLSKFLCLGLLCFSPLLWAQKVMQLDEKSGFKDIQLEDSIQQYLQEFKLLKKSSNGYDVYVPWLENPKVQAKYQRMGILEIQQINLLVYKGVILEIRVFLLPEQFEDLQGILFQVYGEPNAKECETVESELGKRTDCAWKAKKVGMWCSVIFLPEDSKSILAFTQLEKVKKMREELTQAAIKDL